jgi:hypothetical protein
VQNFKEFREKIIRAAECVTNEMLSSGLHVCRATNGAHTEKLCEIQCLKMCRFLQYTQWLKIYNVLFYCPLWPDILHFSCGAA